MQLPGPREDIFLPKLKGRSRIFWATHHSQAPLLRRRGDRICGLGQQYGVGPSGPSQTRFYRELRRVRILRDKRHEMFIASNSVRISLLVFSPDRKARTSVLE